jgi:uncharacterized membrane protein
MLRAMFLEYASDPAVWYLDQQCTYRKHSFIQIHPTVPECQFCEMQMQCQSAIRSVS